MARPTADRSTRPAAVDRRRAIAPAMKMPPSPAAATLSPEDVERLAAFQQMRDLLRDRTRAVAERYQTGCYVVGRPGSSKSYTAQEELKRLDVSWTYRNGRMTAAGLFALLQEHPEDVIILDDIPALLADRSALQVLMAALGGDPGRPRTVTFTGAGPQGRKSFDFVGGIIALSNVPLRRDPLADALQSRVPLLEHEPGDDMLAAFMRSRAAAGFEDLTPAECRQVVDYVIEQSRASDYRLDLRSMAKAWQDFRLCKHGKAHRPWQELIASSLKKLVAPVTASGTSAATRREATMLREREIARELFARFPGAANKAERDAAWRERTGGKSVDTLYRRHRELQDEAAAAPAADDDAAAHPLARASEADDPNAAAA